MGDAYYSDRVRGPRARTEDDIGEQVWRAVVALVERGIGTQLFAQDFPVECDDRKGTYACDRTGLLQTLVAEVPGLELPLLSRKTPDTLAILDTLEFLYRHASAATNGTYHSFLEHYHLRFDRDAGRKLLREDVNRLLARNGLVYELDEEGQVVRLASIAVDAQLRAPLPPTADDRFDQLLNLAADRFLDPDPMERHDGVEKLWDAFERSKTMLNRDKKKGVAALIAETARSPEEAMLLETEMRALTAAGNELAIRHHETGKVMPDSAAVDYLFARMYALLMWIHPALR